jgi:hypothetical protein
VIASATTTAIGFDIARCVAFDLEVYPGRWCVGFHGPDQRGKLTTSIVDGDRGKLAATLGRLVDRGMILVGFNSDHFDIPLIRCILGAIDPFAPAQAIVTDNRLPVALSKLPEFPCDHIDLAARLRRGGRFPGLKTVAANLGRPQLRELPYEPGLVLTDQEWSQVLVYNRVDLEHTWELLKVYGPELQSVAALSNDIGRDLRSTPTPQVVERVFTEAYRQEHGCEPRRPGAPTSVSYRPVVGVLEPRTSGAAAWFREITAKPIPVVTGNAGRRSSSSGNATRR